MLRNFKHITAATMMLAAAGYAVPASAQATRTWVSGVGDDVNPCSRTAPCKTFAGAISKTAPGGEINCLDPAGFGAVTITKSITIDCTGTLGGVLASSTTGVIVNGAGAIVVLRALQINGGPPNLPGVNGVRYLQGASVTIENSTIYNFSAAAPNGYGIIVNPTSGANRLVVNNTTINNNGTATTGGGILIQPTGTASARVQITSSQIVNNPNQAIRVDTTGNTGTGHQVTISNSVLSGNASGLIVVTPAATTTAIVSVFDSTISHNSGTGILANGGTAQVRVGNTKITGNGAGGAGQGGLFVGAGANIVTYGDNALFGNSPDGAFTVGPIGKN